jgi:hypothetical protein
MSDLAELIDRKRERAGHEAAREAAARKAALVAII